MSLEHIESGSFASRSSELCTGSLLKVVTWNINRGRHFQHILEFLGNADADLILLQECDLNATRSGDCNVARDLAQELRLNYVFAAEFQELSQGNGSRPAFHGQAILARVPLSASRVVRFEAQSNFWKPRWFIPNIGPMQRRLGGRMALVSRIRVSTTDVVAYNVHLESRQGGDLRGRQLNELFQDVRCERAEGPVIVGGDFNCDLTVPPLTGQITDQGFRNPFANDKEEKVHMGRYSGSIDFIVFRGPVVPVSRAVHDFTPGSDHSPRSVVFRLC